MVQTEPAQTATPPTPARACRGAMVLCGGLNAPPLAAEIGASPLALPCAPAQTLAERWLAGVSACAGRPRPIWLVGATPDDARPLPSHEYLHAIPDQNPYRGPAGALRDARDHVQAVGHWIVGEANRLYATATLFAELWSLHESGDADITVGLNPDGTFCGLFAMDVANLDLAHPIGFMDLKEQWMSAVQRSGRSVRAHRLGGWGLPMRTRPEYLAALDSAGVLAEVNGRGVVAMSTVSAGPAEAPPRALIAEGARVDATALLIDGVVGAGARVGPRAVVVRSVVMPGGEIGADEVLTDAVRPAGAAER